jgi:hypothetical protein
VRRIEQGARLKREEKRRRIEVQIAEQENHFEIIEMEKKQQMYKIRLEQDLCQICEEFSRLKEKIDRIEADESALALIDVYKGELTNLKKLVEELVLSNSNYINKQSTQIFGGSFLSSLDEATLTQLDLFKTISANLGKQLSEKKNDLERRQDYENSLKSYIELALRYLKPNEKSIKSDLNSKVLFYVQDMADLESSIDSIRSISKSIQDCIGKLTKCEAHTKTLSNRSLATKLDHIETEIVRPLEEQCDELLRFASKWKAFALEYEQFKQSLENELDAPALIKEMKQLREQETVIYYTIDEELCIRSELDKYESLRSQLNAKLVKSGEVLRQGMDLFEINDSNNKARVIVPQMIQDLNETHEFVEELRAYLSSICTELSSACKQIDSLKHLKSSLNEMGMRLDEIEFSNVEQRANRLCAQVKLHNLNDLRKKLKLYEQEKHKIVDLNRTLSDKFKLSQHNLQELDEILQNHTARIDPLQVNRVY